MQRTPLIVIGVALAVLGAGALLWQRINYTQHETIVSIGPTEISADRTRSLALPPILGGVALAGGAALLVLAAFKTK